VSDDQAREEAAETEASTGEDAPVPAPATPKRPMWQRVAELLLPPVLASAAMGVHFALNVPDKIVESPNDQGSKEKKPDKKKKDADKRRAAAKRDEARTPEALDADWDTYRETPFDEEPARTAWARRHQLVINRAVIEARRQAFAGAPEEPNVVLASTTCRTVRCRFTLRSPFPRELDLMTSTLRRLYAEGEPVWRSFEIEPVEATPGAPEGEVEQGVQITVAFLTDETDSNALEIPSATPEADEPNEVGENGGEPDEPAEPEN